MPPPRQIIESLTISELEGISKRVFMELKNSIESQQALLVQEMKTMNTNLAKIDDSLNLNFVRKESFDALNARVDRNTTNIAKAAWSILGTVIAGAVAFLFKS